MSDREMDKCWTMCSAKYLGISGNGIFYCFANLLPASGHGYAE